MAENERDEYIAKLNKQLSKVLAAGDFVNSEGGKLIRELLEADVNTFTKAVLSDKFISDHSGYLDARAKANYAANLLGRILGAADTTQEVSLREQIKKAKGSEDDETQTETEDDE